MTNGPLLRSSITEMKMLRGTHIYTITVITRLKQCINTVSTQILETDLSMQTMKSFPTKKTLKYSISI